ncbi:hypothetical protein GCM10010156_49180 [Planobispora rosea]|uniref:Uncharacterized protein n=1 Tax=Planobispora rosea TaxID=35762 RepID=A0A8J3S416_PLARO|nr:hypothetical protein [Planobispora rosea]GGS84703.1 hypothetical protein GCM10010156_49180 [Planobispora rosea]GIH86429.1 hypothetical protein Pro02_48370 [Planobispora rosea]
MTTITLDQLAHDNRPTQFALLNELVELFTGSPAITHLLVRGSLASGTSDRLSDIDLVVGVHDRQLPLLAENLDALLSSSLGTLLPGWPDTIVAALGGCGWVYLIPHSGHLLQLDLYLAPSTAIASLQQRTGARLLLQRDGAPCTAADTRASTTYLRAAATSSPDARTLLVQSLIIHAMLRKRLLRNQPFIAYDLLGQLHTTLRDLIKITLAPQSRHHGWYHLPDEVGRSPLGRGCLAELEAALAEPSIPTRAQADATVERIWRLAADLVPHAVAALAEAHASYLTYQELA